MSLAAIGPGRNLGATLVPPLGQLGHDVLDGLPGVAVQLVGTLAKGLRPDFQGADGLALHGALRRALQPLSALVEVHLVPPDRQQSLQVLGDDAHLRVLLLVGLLDFPGDLLHLLGQVEGLAGLVDGHGLRPDQADGLRRQLLPEVLRRLVRGVDHPEAPVSGGVSEELGLVRAAHENTLTGELLEPSAVCRTVAVGALGEEQLDRFDLGLLHAGQLADLHDPDALDLFQRLLALDGSQGVREPLTAQQSDEGGLAQALGASQGQHMVEFAAGPVDAGHGGRHDLPGDGPGVLAVLGAHVVDQQGLDSFHAVPLAALQVVLDRVEGVLQGDHVHRVENLVFAGEAVLLFEVVAESGVVAVDPLSAVFDVPPGESIQGDDVVRHQVHGHASGQGGVSVQDDDDVLDTGGDGALLGEAELLRPVGFVTDICVGNIRQRLEVLVRLGHAIGDDLGLHSLIRGGQVGHGSVGRPGADRGVRGDVGVQLVELMQPDDVPGVHELHGGRVCCVVAVGELVLVDDHAGRRAALGVGVAAVAAGNIVRHEGLDGLLDGVGPAEGTDQALLQQRVLLFGRGLLDDLGHAAAHGPA